jgi:hypothetical protein
VWQWLKKFKTDNKNKLTKNYDKLWKTLTFRQSASVKSRFGCQPVWTSHRLSFVCIWQQEIEKKNIKDLKDRQQSVHRRRPDKRTEWKTTSSPLFLYIDPGVPRPVTGKFLWQVLHVVCVLLLTLTCTHCAISSARRLRSSSFTTRSLPKVYVYSLMQFNVSSYTEINMWGDASAWELMWLMLFRVPSCPEILKSTKKNRILP